MDGEDLPRFPTEYHQANTSKGELEHSMSMLSFEPATTHVWDDFRFTVVAQNEMIREQETGNYERAKVAVIDSGFCKHFPSLSGRILNRRAFDSDGVEIDPDTVGPRGCAHGTSCAFLIGGNYVEANYHGIKMGTGRGGLPSCLMGLYSLPMEVTLQSLTSAVMAAIDDGYKVISFSFVCRATSEKNFGILTSGLYFAAMTSGVMICLPAGNDGSTNPFWNTCPFVCTSAACEQKHPIVTELELVDGSIIKGAGINLVQHMEFYYMRDGADAYDIVPGGERQLRQCTFGEFSQAILVFLVSAGQELADLIRDALTLGAKGVIFFFGYEEIKQVPLMTHDIAMILIGNEDGDLILNMIKDNSPGQVMGKIHKSKVEENPRSVRLASFSSRLPTNCPRFLLKPEISAPGCQICMALVVETIDAQPEYGIDDGTSFSTPIIATVFAYLKARHPDWTFPEIRSAIMTCADVFENFRHFRDRLACGTGIVNPAKADDAALLYDISMKQYSRIIQGYPCDENMFEIAENFYDASMDDLEKKNHRNFNFPAFKDVITVDPENPMPQVYKRKVRFADGGKGIFSGDFEYDGCSRENVSLVVDPPMLVFKGNTEENGRKKERLCYTVTVTVLKWNPENLIYCRLMWTEQGGKGRVSICPIVIDNEAADVAMGDV